MIQIERLEAQRTRLRKQLDNVESFQEKITIEKFIFNLDIKIAYFKIRLVESQRYTSRKVINALNERFSREKRPVRVLEPDRFIDVSPKVQAKISKIFKEATRDYLN